MPCVKCHHWAANGRVGKVVESVEGGNRTSDHRPLFGVARDQSPVSYNITMWLTQGM